MEDGRGSSGIGSGKSIGLAEGILLPAEAVESNRSRPYIEWLCYTDIVRAKITRDIFGSDYIGPSVDAAYVSSHRAFLHHLGNSYEHDSSTLSLSSTSSSLLLYESFHQVSTQNITQQPGYILRDNRCVFFLQADIVMPLHRKRPHPSLTHTHIGPNKRTTHMHARHTHSLITLTEYICL